MTRTARRLVLAALFAVGILVVGAPTAFAQGGVTSTLTGTVVDSSGAVIPGASVVVKRADTGVTTEAVSNAEGQFTVPALNRLVVRLQDRHGEQRRGQRGRARGRQGHDGNRRHRRTGRGAGRRRDRQDAGVHRVDDAQREADSEPAADQPRRAAVRRQPAGRQHAGHGAQLHGERPAAGLDQHHPRRHLDPGQLPEDERRPASSRASTPSRKSR